MIRKIAFIGGYGSVLCICLAIMFFTLSSFKGKKTSLMLSSAQMEWRLNSPESSSFRASQEYKDFNRAEITANITSYKRYVLGETLLIVACLLFITTFLPYQFYSKYQKQNLGIAQV